ncbi:MULTISPECIES: universal stress protein [Cyanophyceae]|uniref:universal stress protein n=1 Tax=Cyanophyceae TaxID=3028117 RepID=UPI001358A705|nr:MULTISPECIES: universal stress protein [Cyanophyceae]NMG57938.1 sensor histidine kinase KdpD [Geitlerinema sp. P-1104]
MYHSSQTLHSSSSVSRGKHRVFIGMAPGVGKTYRMLDEAQQLKKDGVDVVIGWLEPHGRIETSERAIGLEQIPPKPIAWQGRSLLEMDTEAILARSPQLVLVDELAHTNVPGSPCKKRYQDVERLLDAGLDVHSTVNIQHFESLNDLVYKIAGVVVRERIPDRIIEQANEVVVVDVTPETLQERLQDGKIYSPDKIDSALQHFFQRRNLIALRELALREVADNIEDDTVAAHPDCCPIRERILVCVSTYPQSLHLLRRGVRFANRLNGRLYALFVGNPDQFLSKDEALHIETCQRLCEEFGGEFLRERSTDLVETIVSVAQEHSITQIVLGETHRSRWSLFWRGSLVQQLMRSLPDVSLQVLATQTDEQK